MIGFMAAHKLCQPTTFSRAWPEFSDRGSTDRRSLQLSGPTCDKPLGMQSGGVRATQVSASSSWDKNHAPNNGRLNYRRVGARMGAWCSRQNNYYQWLQVDLKQTTRVTKIATQGRQDARQWVTKYYLSYSQDGAIFAEFKKNSNRKVKTQFTSRHSHLRWHLALLLCIRVAFSICMLRSKRSSQKTNLESNALVEFTSSSPNFPLQPPFPALSIVHLPHQCLYLNCLQRRSRMPLLAFFLCMISYIKQWTSQSCQNCLWVWYIMDFFISCIHSISVMKRNCSFLALFPIASVVFVIISLWAASHPSLFKAYLTMFQTPS